MYLECTCVDISLERWNQLMKGARKCSYKNLLRRIKNEMRELYDGFCLDYYNPYWEQCKQTKTHYILVSSGVEYFICK